MLWLSLRALPGWLRLLPSLAARTFWGTTIRGTGDQVELRLDTQYMVEPGGEEFCATAHLHRITGTVVIETNGQQLAVETYDLGVAVHCHPDETGFVLQEFEYFWPCTTHHLNLRWLLFGGLFLRLRWCLGWCRRRLLFSLLRSLGCLMRHRILRWARLRRLYLFVHRLWLLWLRSWVRPRLRFGLLWLWLWFRLRLRLRSRLRLGLRSWTLRLGSGSFLRGLLGLAFAKYGSSGGCGSG